jgi:hypothetical protein
MYSSVSLEYFRAYSRAESIRMMLAYAGQSFENKFVDNWAEVKGKAPY